MTRNSVPIDRNGSFAKTPADNATRTAGNADLDKFIRDVIYSLTDELKNGEISKDAFARIMVVVTDKRPQLPGATRDILPQEDRAASLESLIKTDPNTNVDALPSGNNADELPVKRARHARGGRGRGKRRISAVDSPAAQPAPRMSGPTDIVACSDYGCHLLYSGGVGIATHRDVNHYLRNWFVRLREREPVLKSVSVAGLMKILRLDKHYKLGRVVVERQEDGHDMVKISDNTLAKMIESAAARDGPIDELRLPAGVCSWIDANGPYHTDIIADVEELCRDVDDTTVMRTFNISDYNWHDFLERPAGPPSPCIRIVG
ncbi:hypothetical protein CSOJ01_07240 [Colletotrichum sojae]|uniref:Uncharacterized protein n=1 Tax=Colletotrichum sojae TaxID=2175907 RepID=A0A8H6MUK9_9PEZI|nr:hypothetical protein CSOJ01_07240 [Colletotrichum sojae]